MSDYIYNDPQYGGPSKVDTVYGVYMDEGGPCFLVSAWKNKDEAEAEAERLSYPVSSLEYFVNEIPIMAMG